MDRGLTWGQRLVTNKDLQVRGLFRADEQICRSNIVTTFTTPRLVSVLWLTSVRCSHQVPSTKWTPTSRRSAVMAKKIGMMQVK